MVLNNRMSQVAGALAGGTSDLRTFGDIGANLGDTLLNMAPHLPGLGPDLLGGLKGATGALASTTGFLGKTGLLAPLLAARGGIPVGRPGTGRREDALVPGRQAGRRAVRAG